MVSQARLSVFSASSLNVTQNCLLKIDMHYDQPQTWGDGKGWVIAEMVLNKNRSTGNKVICIGKHMKNSLWAFVDRASEAETVLYLSKSIQTPFQICELSFFGVNPLLIELHIFFSLECQLEGYKAPQYWVVVQWNCIRLWWISVCDSELVLQLKSLKSEGSQIQRFQRLV